MCEEEMEIGKRGYCRNVVLWLGLKDWESREVDLHLIPPRFLHQIPSAPILWCYEVRNGVRKRVENVGLDLGFAFALV